MLTKLGKRLRQIRRRYSRSELLNRWLGCDVKQEESNEPGLVILQIDGLSRKQFEAALAKKRLPFLKKLIDRGYFTRLSFYAGLPATTPSVQGEIMYGVKSAVPAWQFLHRKSGQVLRMFDHEAAKTIVDERLKDTEPLLRDGASFSNIYSGGAKQARFCSETTNPSEDVKKLNPIHLLLIFVLYFFTFLRILCLAAIEFFVAVGDMIKGVVTRKNWRNEIAFIPTRVLVSIILREWLRIVVKLAISQGKPVIYGNFLGYDVQAHVRGPSAAFAHWGLKGIDHVIEDIFRTARRSDLRDYELIVLSDHGQEESRIYEFEYGQTIEEAIKKSIEAGPLGQRIVQRADWKATTHLDQRTRRMMRIRRGQIPTPEITKEEFANNVIVTALGPLGHIYFPMPATEQLKAECARELVERHHVPLALYVKEDGNIVARNESGLWKIPEDIPKVFGADHDFAPEMKEDLVRLAHHPDAGDVLISGFHPERKLISFVQENGAHADMGLEELKGFALIPRRIHIPKRHTPQGEAYIRGIDVYHAGLKFLGRGDDSDSMSENQAKVESAMDGGQRRESARDRAPSLQRISRESSEDDAPAARRIPLRVMTYNIHHCIGLDGKCRPQRIAEIIEDLDPDVVAIQEIDLNRPRTHRQDQAQLLASHLGMRHQFFPVWCEEDEQYGLAILSKLPFTIVREGLLTEACSRAKREARGTIWVSLETETGESIHFLNTHLGLGSKERLSQIEGLLGESWLRDRFGDEPVIIAGDFNAGPRSLVMKRLSKHLHCVQLKATGHRPRRTFFSMFPIRRIDHILVSQHFHVEKVSVPKDHFTAVASDHLPVCADLVLNLEGNRSPEEASAPRSTQSENDQHALPCVRHRL